MSVSLTNRDDIVVNSTSLIQQSVLYDLGDNLSETVQSLPNKADNATTYTKVQTYNQTEINYVVFNLSDTGFQQKYNLKQTLLMLTDG